MTQLEKLKTAESTYNELIANMNKFETTEQFFDEMGFCYDACLFYICYLIGLEYNMYEYTFLDNAISDEYSWQEIYENIHDLGL